MEVEKNLSSGEVDQSTEEVAAKTVDNLKGGNFGQEECSQENEENSPPEISNTSTSVFYAESCVSQNEASSCITLDITEKKTSVETETCDPGVTEVISLTGGLEHSQTQVTQSQTNNENATKEISPQETQTVPFTSQELQVRNVDVNKDTHDPSADSKVFQSSMADGETAPPPSSTNQPPMAPWDDYKPKSPINQNTESSNHAPSVVTSDATPTTEGSVSSREHAMLSPVAAASAMSQGATSSLEARESLSSIYHVKWVKFNTKQLPIVTQNENGPCPLIAIMNVLFLREKIKVPAIVQMVTSDQLMEYLGDYIFEHVPKDITDDTRLNYEQNMHDAMAVFHKLQTGLDVNVRFTGVNDFEYTPECIVFDLLHIPLYHGWLVDPQDLTTVKAVGNCGYNQLVEKIIGQKCSDKQDLVTEALAAESFLENSMSQLTYHGLSELSQTVKEQQMCVFFRNNHFSTLYRNKDELFLLVTDQGFLTETNVVWETLSNVEGDGHFVDAEFRNFQKPQASTAPISTPTVAIGSESQVDQDYLVALSLEQEQRSAQTPPSWQDSGLSDHDLAMQLQEEENRLAAEAQQRAAPVAPRAPLPGQSQPAAVSTAPQRKKDNNCTIL